MELPERTNVCNYIRETIKLGTLKKTFQERRLKIVWTYAQKRGGVY